MSLHRKNTEGLVTKCSSWSNNSGRRITEITLSEEGKEEKYLLQRQERINCGEKIRIHYSIDYAKVRFIEDYEIIDKEGSTIYTSYATEPRTRL